METLASTTRILWNPVKTEDTNTSNYWLNWRVSMCALLVLISMGFASFLISRYEGPRDQNGGERKKENVGILYADEVWKPCLKGMHPGWLLAFRVCGFFVLLTVLIVNAIVDDPSIFYYYTQWTVALGTIYFGLGFVLSMYGCYEYHNKVIGDRVDNIQMDAERGGGYLTAKTNLSSHELNQRRPVAGFWGYSLQIIYQMNAGAVMVTDCVFWFIIAPFLSTKKHNIDFFMVNMHTVNLLFLLGDTALNCLRFPWFRIAYFILWTSFYVIFQWLLHACISIWWPYPFLDLSSSFSPLWYLTVAIMHFACYGIFFLLIKLKHMLLSTYFPDSYQCSR